MNRQKTTDAAVVVVVLTIAFIINYMLMQIFSEWLGFDKLIVAGVMGVGCATNALVKTFGKNTR